MNRRERRAQQQQEQRRRSAGQQLCAYCDLRPGIEEEHVVASCFFNPTPPNMIKVPSCSECNRGRGDGGPRDLSLDEEYMRNVLCMQDDPIRHPSAQRLLIGPVFRSLNNSPSLKRRIMKTVRMLSPVNDQGIILPMQPTFTLEFDRIERVTRKIVRGLYYAKEGKALPRDTQIEVIPRLTNEMFHVALTSFNEPANEWQGFEDRAFMYKAARFGPNAPDCYRTAWILMWYGSYTVMAATEPRSAAA